MPIEVRKSRWRSAGSLVGSMVILGISIYALVNRESTWLAWVAIAIFGGSAFFFLGHFFVPKTRFAISEEGICAAHWNVGTIPWNDLSDVFIKTDGGDDYICLTLRYPEYFRSRMNKIALIFNTATRQTGFSDFSIKPVDMGLDTNVIFELVKEQIDLAKTKPKSTGQSFKYHPGD